MREERGVEMRMDTCRMNVLAIRTRAARARKRGSAVLEFAFSSLVLLALLFGMIDFCRVFYTYEFVTYAARAGARWAMVRGNQCYLANPASWCDPAGSATSGATAADIQTYVRSIHMPGVAVHLISVPAVCWPASGPAPGCPPPTTLPLSCISANGVNSPGCPVQVWVQYPYKLSIPFLSIKTLTLTADSQMVISQ